jgi:hypothetical protein
LHAPSEELSDESKDSFYEELEQVFYHFPKYHIKILLEDFDAKVGRENMFKPTIWNGSLHRDSNDNGVRIVNFATSKNLVIKSTMFQHRNIHKYTRTSPDGHTHNQIDRTEHSPLENMLVVQLFKTSSYYLDRCPRKHYLLTPWSRVLLEKLTSFCS